MKEFEYVRPRILTAGYLNSIGNISTTLLETSCTARVNPENPCLRRSISNSITVFDSKLRFSSKLSAAYFQAISSVKAGHSELTRHHRGRQALPGTPVQRLSHVSDQVAFHDRQSLGRDGTEPLIEGSVEFSVALSQEAAVSQFGVAWYCQGLVKTYPREDRSVHD
jgi:hypothetical protein